LCPKPVEADYYESVKLLDVSPPASAAFSRRCLQALLTSRGYTQGKLVKQIEALLGESDHSKILPHYVATSVDAIRNFGNFSAHAIGDSATAEIIAVEPGEAEWCIEIMEDLFDHYFARPSAELAKIESINAKLKAAGKPEMKTPPVRSPDDAG
jgi:hypothetical protein